MTRRSLRERVERIRDELGSPRSVLEAFARAACEHRGMKSPDEWSASETLSRALRPDFLARDDAPGDVYQALNASTLESAYRATAREGRKFAVAEVPAVTGLFTPRWVAEFLLQNTLGRRWIELHPDSSLMQSARWLVPRAANPYPIGRENAGVLRARDLRILDPACGSMNFGLAAVDLLREMYREEIDRAGRPGWPGEPSVAHEADIDEAILRYNLFGIEVDPTALWLAQVTLNLKAGIEVQRPSPNLIVADGLFDDGIPKSWLGGFDVVVTNPPYLSARNLDPGIVKRLKTSFPVAWRDLYACFIDRCFDYCAKGGRIGLLTMQSFMFTGAFEALRTRIDERSRLETLVHLGPGLWDAGNPGTLQTVAFTASRDRAPRDATAFQLTDFTTSDLKESGLRSMLAARSAGELPKGVYPIEPSGFAEMPRRAWTYWATPQLREAFATLPKLRDLAPPRQGLATTDNARFVRYWWEVEPTCPSAPLRAAGNRWFPYAKSGRFRRWYEATRHRVNWEDDGREIKQEIVRRYPYLKGDWKWVAKNSAWYGRPNGITYSYLTSGQFSARRLEPGTIFDVAGSSLFGDDPLTLLAVLNSSIASELLSIINPTVNFQVGDLAELPVPTRRSAQLHGQVSDAIDLQRRLDTFDETTTDFIAPAPWPVSDDPLATLHAQLRSLERRIDDEVIELYGMRASRDTKSAYETTTPSAASDRVELARRWVSFAIGRCLGRWGDDPLRDPVLRIQPVSSALLNRIEGELEHAAGGGAAVDEMDAALGGIARFIEKDFYAWHVRHYSRRPVYWGLSDGSRTVLLAHDHADAPTMRGAMRQIGASLPRGWKRSMDHGVAVGLAPFAKWLADASLRKALERVADDQSSGRMRWTNAAECPRHARTKRRVIA